MRIKVREREARYRKVSYDPFSAMETLGLPFRQESEAALRTKPTDRQIQTLMGLGIADAHNVSRRRASILIGIGIARRSEGKATIKQVGSLIKNGIDPKTARAMSFTDAGETLNRLFGRKSAV